MSAARTMYTRRYRNSLVQAIISLFRVWRKEESEIDEILRRNHCGNYRNTFRRSIHATISADGKDINDPLSPNIEHDIDHYDGKANQTKSE